VDLLSLVTEPLLGRFANIVGLESEVRNGI